MATTLYGIKNCDTCTKARRWLFQQGIEHGFVDLRADGISPHRLTGWVDTEGWKTLLNRRSRTWRELPEEDKRDLDEAKAVQLMHQHPTLIKRPVLESRTGVIVGFSEAAYETALAGAD